MQKDKLWQKDPFNNSDTSAKNLGAVATKFVILFVFVYVSESMHNNDPRFWQKGV